MKKFLLLVFLFFLLTAVMLAAGEYAVRRIPNPYSAKREAISRFGKDTETVVLGSSHTYYGVVADSLDRTLNLANVSQTFEYDYRILNRYIDSFPRLKRVIIPISFFSFFDPPFDRTDERYLETYYKIYLGIDKYPAYSPKAFELSSFVTYSGKLKSLIERKPGPQTSPKGFGLDYADSKRVADIEAEAGSAAERHATMPLGYEAYEREWFEKLIELCRERGIEPVLISTPVTEYYLRALDPTQFRRMRTLVSDYCQRYSLAYHDFSSAPGFTDLDFRDGDHLCHSGALRFTRLLRPLLQ